MKNNFPKIATCDEEHAGYAEEVKKILEQLLPLHFFRGEGSAHRFHRLLPLIGWTPVKTPPFEMAFFVCCPSRENAFRFFQEMISRWLVPGKRINTLLQFAIDFTLPDLGDHTYMGGKVILHIPSNRELAALQVNLSLLDADIRLGLQSEYHANRILETKGLTSGEKTALIQDSISSLVQRRPQDFDYDIYTEMQHFLVGCKEEFKTSRSYRHMSRIICTHYLFRKALKLCLETFPERRYISVKLIRTALETAQKKKVLGIAMCFSFLRSHELFEKEHLLNSVRALIPTVHTVEGSFFKHGGKSDSLQTFYLEVEKENGNPFSLMEIKKLKQDLPGEVKNHIEERHHHLFMPSNEEEILRHILSLSTQLKYVNDLPQAVITFNTQTEHTLEFLVIVLRVEKPHSCSIQDAFDAKWSHLEFIPDRIKIVGSIRKKYRKEATVFRLRIQKDPFLRTNHSVDLYKARHEVVAELSRVMGEFRDFNGGTISKETEAFQRLQAALGKEALDHAFLLEDFFFSLSPPVMRSVLEPAPLKTLFSLLLEGEREGLSKGQPYSCQIRSDSKNLYVVLTALDSSFHEILSCALEELKAPSLSLATCFLQAAEFPSWGLIYHNPASEDALKLRLTIERTMQEWSEGAFLKN